MSTHKYINKIHLSLWFLMPIILLAFIFRTNRHNVIRVNENFFFETDIILMVSLLAILVVMGAGYYAIRKKHFILTAIHILFTVVSFLYISYYFYYQHNSENSLLLLLVIPASFFLFLVNLIGSSLLKKDQNP